MRLLEAINLASQTTGIRIIFAFKKVQLICDPLSVILLLFGSGIRSSVLTIRLVLIQEG